MPVSVSRTSGQGLLDPMARRRASAAPASSDCEKSQRWSGPRWPAMPHSASANWNCRMVRVKYLPERGQRRNYTSILEDYWPSRYIKFTD